MTSLPQGTIGQAVRALRKHQGKSQSELGINKMTVSCIESDQRNHYSDEKLHAVIAALGCTDVADLVTKAQAIQRWSDVTRQSDGLRVEMVGQAVRALREHQSKSQSELGENRTTVSFIESGQREKYSAEKLQTVIEALGCADVPDLLAKAQPIQRWSGVTEQSNDLRAKLIGQAVRALRGHQGKSQSELGENQTAVFYIESGQCKKYSAEKLQVVIEALGCTDLPDLLAKAEALNEHGSNGRYTSRENRRDHDTPHR